MSKDKITGCIYFKTFPDPPTVAVAVTPHHKFFYFLMCGPRCYSKPEAVAAFLWYNLRLHRIFGREWRPKILAWCFKRPPTRI